jgi:hypothetical protein
LQARTRLLKATTNSLLPSFTVSGFPITHVDIDNLTKEQFSGVAKRQSGVLSASRDTLNPLLNTETLKNRLAVIEHYRYVHGVEYAHWPHFAMSRLARHVFRYKVNYAIKGFAAYLIYRDVAQYRHLKATTFMTIPQELSFGVSAAFHSGLLLGICCLI